MRIIIKKGIKNVVAKSYKDSNFFENSNIIRQIFKKLIFGFIVCRRVCKYEEFKGFFRAGRLNICQNPQNSRRGAQVTIFDFVLL